MYCSSKLLSFFDFCVKDTIGQSENPVSLVADTNSVAHKNLDRADDVPKCLTQQVVSILSPPHRDVLIKNRQILMDYLSRYIVLDELGYPVLEETHALEKLRQELTDNQSKVKELADIFGNVAFSGDAGYAHDMRIFLAGQGIVSPQVKKGEDSLSLDPSCRPQSCVGLRAVLSEPRVYVTKTEYYIDLWGNAIWEGYKKYRERQFNILDKIAPNKPRKARGQDSLITTAQVAHYEASCQRIEALHQEGLLVVRCANLKEASNLAACRMPNSGYSDPMPEDTLSTTLIPAAKSMITMCLYNNPPYGLLLDFARTHTDNFAAAFADSGGTLGRGFLNLVSLFDLTDSLKRTAPFLTAHQEILSCIKKETSDMVPMEIGACSIESERNRLQALDIIIRHGGDVSSFKTRLTHDRQDWEFEKKSDQIIDKELFLYAEHICYNELVFYRGIAGDLLTGLFLDSKICYSPKNLRDLFVAQDHIRRTKGRFLPVYELNRETNQLHEIPPNAFVLHWLQLDHIPPINRPWKKIEILKELGIDQIKFLNDMENLPRYAEKLCGTSLYINSLLEWQLWVFQAEKEETTDLRLLRDIHLVFPNIFSNNHPLASSQHVSFFKDRELMKKTPILSTAFASLFVKNLDKILGIKLEANGEIEFTDKGSLFHKMALPEGEDAELHFTNAVIRAMQTMMFLNMFGDETGKIITKIVACIRKQNPSFGYEKKDGMLQRDTILDGSYMHVILADQGKPNNYLIEISKKSLPPKILSKL